MNRMIPTSADIYLELNGIRVAVVQSYSVTTTRSSRVIEAFGQEEPVATIAGANQYTIDLSRIYATDEALADGISFHDLADFLELPALSVAPLQPPISLPIYSVSVMPSATVKPSHRQQLVSQLQFSNQPRSRLQFANQFRRRGKFQKKQKALFLQ